MASQPSSQNGLEIQSTQAKREACIRWTDTEVQKNRQLIIFSRRKRGPDQFHIFPNQQQTGSIASHAGKLWIGK